MRKWAIAPVAAILPFFFSPFAQAATVPDIFYNPAYVGNSWTYAGTYDDSLPEEGASTEEVVADINDYSTSFSSYELNGSLPSDAEIDVEYQNSSGSTVGNAKLYAASINQQITVPAGTWSMIFRAYEASNTSGDFWLTETWSNAYNVSTTGEVIWTKPSWAFTSSGSSNTGYPPPPNWNEIEQEIGHDIWFEAPPIPAPPTGSDQITASPALSAPTVDAPQEPNITVPQTFDFTSGVSSIDVPTAGSSAFTIGDPDNLPHQDPGTILIPGQAGNVGYKPQSPTLANSNPLPSNTPPAGSSGPAPADLEPTSGLGPSPEVAPPQSGTGAIPQSSAPQMYTPPVPSLSPPTSAPDLNPTYTGQTIQPSNQPMYTIPGTGP